MHIAILGRHAALMDQARSLAGQSGATASCHLDDASLLAALRPGAFDAVFIGGGVPAPDAARIEAVCRTHAIPCRIVHGPGMLGQVLRELTVGR